MLKIVFGCERSSRDFTAKIAVSCVRFFYNVFVGKFRIAKPYVGFTPIPRHNITNTRDLRVQSRSDQLSYYCGGGRIYCRGNGRN